MLSELQMTNLEREGYLVIEGLFASDDLLPVKDEFSILIDHQAQKLYPVSYTHLTLPTKA